MGLFDSVFVNCPDCGSKAEFQSKEGECGMNHYTPETAPDEVLRDVLNDPRYCQHCGGWLVLIDSAFPPDHKPPRPRPRAVMTRTPPNVHIHPLQPYLRWWPDEPFTYADLRDATS